MVDCESGCIRASQRGGGITRDWTNHRQIQNVSLKLHEQIVLYHATVGA